MEANGVVSSQQREEQTPSQPDDDQLAERIAAIRARVAAAAGRAGRAPESVSIIAVSKTMPAQAVIAAVAHGLSLFGENRVQEAREKITAVADAGLTDHPLGVDRTLADEQGRACGRIVCTGAECG